MCFCQAVIQSDIAFRLLQVVFNLKCSSSNNDVFGEGEYKRDSLHSLRGVLWFVKLIFNGMLLASIQHVGVFWIVTSFDFVVIKRKFLVSVPYLFIIILID